MEIIRCELCGNIIVKLVDGGPTPVCCGQEMKVLSAGTTDAALEKHVPALELDGHKLTVQVGDVLHPMTPEHYIQFILVEQDGYVMYKQLTPNDEPKARFKVSPGKPFKVYEFCNLHGLWMSEK